MERTAWWVWPASALAALGTLLATMVAVRVAPGVKPPSHAVVVTGSAAAGAAPGVMATITAGEVTITRPLPALAFALQPGQTLDARLPAGPFAADFAMTFHPGEVSEATIGAEFEGGSLIVLRGDEALLSDHAGEGARRAFSQPIQLRPRLTTLTYRFTADGTRPSRLRALWQPATSSVPTPLRGLGAGIIADDAARGLALVQQLNCVACHASADQALHKSLDVNPGPILSNAGARLRPAWIRRWLRDPHQVKPGTMMPGLFAVSAGDAELIEAVTHYLASLGGPLQDAPEALDQDLVATGGELFHRVGCVACHGPIAGPRTGEVAREARAASGRSIPAMSEKTNLGALSAFLADPVAVHPGGRMPSMNLTFTEASAVASYLIDAAGVPANEALQPDGEFKVDLSLAARGREAFRATGCANCHEVIEPGREQSGLLPAPSLEAVVAAVNVSGGDPSGCLSNQPRAGVPDFAMTQRHRRQVMAYLSRLPSHRSADVPLDGLAAAIERLDCTACHEAFGAGGPSEAAARHFHTQGEVDLGEEGRLPPSLTNVGARLQPGALRSALEGADVARPYLATRMPRFGSANVAPLPAWFMAAAGVDDEPSKEPAIAPDAASIGRRLVGSKGLNCIQCHGIAGRPATGTPGTDLAQMAGRLRHEHFVQALDDPNRLRPGTRMPAFWIEGYSSFLDLLGGESRSQIDAIWSYLSQGEMLALPEGLVDPRSLELSVTDRPIIFRTFMHDAGVRAIACGYPEQVHCAFDPNRCCVALAWSGQFLNATGAWAARGGSETNPGGEQWRRTPGPAFTITMNGSSALAPRTRFRGYRLDEEGRPTFQYELQTDYSVIRVSEQPVPGTVGSRSLILRLTFNGPPGATVSMPGHAAVSASSAEVATGSLTLASSTSDAAVLLDEAGQGAAEIEVKW